MSNGQDDFSHYGKHFQEALVLLLLRDRQFCDQMGEVLREDFFETRYLRVFANVLLGYRTKYKVHPSIETMTTLVRSAPEIEVETEVVQKQLREFFARAYTIDVTDEAQYIKDTALDFCRRQTVKEAMLKAVRLVQTSSFDEVSKVLNDALKAGSSNDFGYDYLLDFERRFNPEDRKPISTGWTVIDGITRGGFGRGELVVAIAKTNGGKSFLLVHLGAHAILQGKTVIHYTLELSDADVASRYDACICDIPLDSLIHEKEVIRGIVSNLDGSLIVKEYPTKTASVQTIRNHLDRLRTRGVKPDMIVVDYADLLKPVKASAEAMRHDLQSIYEELRAVAKIYDCIVVTASQSHRMQEKDNLITMEDISEAYNKCFVADFIFTLSRSQAEIEKSAGRVFVAKNRAGRANIVYEAFVDFARSKVRIFESEQTPSEASKKTLQEQQINLKKVYREFRQTERQK